MTEEGTRIWVSVTRRLKLLVQDILWTVFILLWVQGSFLLRIWIWIWKRIRIQVTTCAAFMLRLSLPHDSTNYAGLVSPLLTLVALPEAGFITLLLEWTSSSTSLVDSHGHVRVARAAHVSANIGWCEELEPLEALMGLCCLESHLTESPIVTHRFHVGL